MFEGAKSYGVLPASDLTRAVKWWKDVFGMDPDMTDEGGAMFQLGGTPVLVYETQFAGTAQNTSFGLFTDDLDRDMAALREKGVTFNEYDLPGLKTENGVVDLDGERGAWFNDSEGNIISIAQPTSVTIDEAKAMLAGRRS